jgi:hypothetical protein
MQAYNLSPSEQNVEDARPCCKIDKKREIKITASKANQLLPKDKRTNRQSKEDLQI